MIQEELTHKKYRFPELFDTSKTPYLPKEQPAETVLEAYFPGLSERDHFPSGTEEKYQGPTPEDYRRQALEIANYV